jgi:Secretion system C-terminal sorting domain
MKKIFTFPFLFFIIFANAQSPIDKVVNIKVSTQLNPAKITLSWNPKLTATGYSIYRKLRNGVSWTLLATKASNADTVYVDNAISPSIGYEYKVSTVGSSVEAIGYVYAAINLPPNHNVGRLLVLIDSAYINYCAAEIKQYLEDIIKDGWRVSTKYIGRNTPIEAVKQSVKNLYLQDVVNTKGLFLLGHIPVPYSGTLAPDGHGEHYGAWPTDWYYADTTSTYWTDVSVNISTAGRSENNNVPGDGKFDQSTIPYPYINFFVTRVDVFNMPTINANDSILMKNYLQKDHAYRSMQKTFRMRALVDDNFGYFNGEAFAQNGYRNGINLLGKDSVFDADYTTAMNSQNESYLWSYGCGGGWYQGASGVGSTTNFQSSNLNSVFTMLFGSYFGDWDNGDNFLRAPLASSSPILTNCWAGRPHWFFHAMGLGECIGFSVYDQGKTPFLYSPSNFIGAGSIHNEFLGDPTLRMYLSAPASNLTMATNVSVVNCNWSASTDTGVIGYYVYRAASLSDTFKLLNQNYTTALSFMDNTAPAGKNVYMVRSVKLQNTISSGSFLNLSAGVIDSINVSVVLPIKLVNFSVNEMNCKTNILWDVVLEENIDHYEVWRSKDGITFDTKICEIKAKGISSGIQNYVCTDAYPLKTNFYKLICIDKDFRNTTYPIIKLDIYNNICNDKNNIITGIYPNPVMDILYVDIEKNSNSLETINLVVTDLNGRKLLSKKNELSGNHTILIMPVAELSLGVYFINIEWNNGLRKVVYKFEKLQ